MATADWRTWCAADDLVLDGDLVEVKLANGRHHRIKVEHAADAFRLSGVVVGRSLSEFDGLEQEVWARNRRQMLVGFRFDKHDRLVGETWVPRAALTKDEFLLYLRTLAQECDRYEFQLAGVDRQ